MGKAEDRIRFVGDRKDYENIVENYNKQVELMEDTKKNMKFALECQEVLRVHAENAIKTFPQEEEPKESIPLNKQESKE